MSGDLAMLFISKFYFIMICLLILKFAILKLKQQHSQQNDNKCADVNGITKSGNAGFEMCRWQHLTIKKVGNSERIVYFE